jgi:hypothetical protein
MSSTIGNGPQKPERLIDDVLYSTKEAASFLGRSHRTLEAWRRIGIGPRVTRIHEKALPYYLGRHLRDVLESGDKREAKQVDHNSISQSSL